MNVSNLLVDFCSVLQFIQYYVFSVHCNVLVILHMQHIESIWGFPQLGHAERNRVTSLLLEKPDFLAVNKLNWISVKYISVQQHNLVAVDPPVLNN